MARTIQDAAREGFEQREYLTHVCKHNSEVMAERLVLADYSKVFGAAGSPSPVQTVRRLPAVFAETDIVIWQGDMYNLAMKGAKETFIGTTAPPHLSELHTPQLWFLSEGGFFFTNSASIFGIPQEARCWSAFVLPDYVDDVFYGVSVGYLFWNPLDPIPYFCPTPTLRPGATVTGIQSIFMALFEFMRLPLASIEPTYLPRPNRRRLQREGKSIPQINVIQLRKREPSGWHTTNGREYHHQWVVKGHWRRLHKPRKADGAQVTFVDSYVKGPEGAPLLPPRETVFAVTR